MVHELHEKNTIHRGIDVVGEESKGLKAKKPEPPKSNAEKIQEAGKKAADTMRKLDLFGRPVALLFNNEDKYKSVVGGMLSLSVLCLLLFYFAYSLLFFMQRSGAIYSSVGETNSIPKKINMPDFNDKASKIRSPQELVAGLMITGLDQSNLLTQKNYLNVTFSFHGKRENEIKPIGEMVQTDCSKYQSFQTNSTIDNEGHGVSFYKLYQMEQAICVSLSEYYDSLFSHENQNITLQGNEISEEYNFLQISIEVCKNGTLDEIVCKPLNEIMSKVDKAQVKYIFTSKMFYANNTVPVPLQNVSSYFNYKITKEFFRTQQIQVQKNFLIDYFDLFNANPPPSPFMSYGDNGNSNLDFVDSNSFGSVPLLVLQIQSAQIAETYTRKFMTVQEFFVNIAGILNGIFAGGTGFGMFINKMMLKIDLINKTFFLVEDEEEVRKREKKKKTKDKAGKSNDNDNGNKGADSKNDDKKKEGGEKEQGGGEANEEKKLEADVPKKKKKKKKADSGGVEVELSNLEPKKSGLPMGKDDEIKNDVNNVSNQDSSLNASNFNSINYGELNNINNKPLDGLDDKSEISNNINNNSLSQQNIQNLDMSSTNRQIVDHEVGGGGEENSEIITKGKKKKKKSKEAKNESDSPVLDHQPNDNSLIEEKSNVNLVELNEKDDMDKDKDKDKDTKKKKKTKRRDSVKEDEAEEDNRQKLQELEDFANANAKEGKVINPYYKETTLKISQKPKLFRKFKMTFSEVMASLMPFCNSKEIVAKRKIFNECGAVIDSLMGIERIVQTIREYEEIRNIILNSEDYKLLKQLTTPKIIVEDSDVTIKKIEKFNISDKEIKANYLQFVNNMNKIVDSPYISKVELSLLEIHKESLLTPHAPVQVNK